MDNTFTGKYGNLRAASLNFLSKNFIEELLKKEQGDFIPSLSRTNYKHEIDRLINMYPMPDSVEVIINSHMVGSLSNAYAMMPPLARDFVRAYSAKWDIENIKGILSAKASGYELSQTESFLVVQQNNPISTISGSITAQQYSEMLGLGGVEEIINYLVRFGYGAIMLKSIDEYRNTRDLSSMFLALDMHYYSNLLQSLRFYNGDEWQASAFVRELIDWKNIISVIKATSFGKHEGKGFAIGGGNIREEHIYTMTGKEIQSLKGDIPYEIDWAFEAYKSDPLIIYFDSAIKRAIYKKYLKMFGSSPSSLSYIMRFILRCEIERDDLRSIWLIKHYGIKGLRAESTITTSYIE